ncbi:uncharacterized protein LOC143368002 [Andrena cerasifolii]|uniref:uncharacterized protein LOC143368002 n=1 Tax=Andrena cerasifolii TaxID=2819439 RepID=UPI0040383270
MNDKPSVPEEESSEKRNSIKISNSMLQRLEFGREIQYVTHRKAAAVERNGTESDDAWINKLATIDEEHTKTKGLDITAAEKVLRDISRVTTPKSDRSCLVDTVKVTECMNGNKGNTLACGKEVHNFKQCIDKLMYDAVRKDMKEVRSSKKESYVEAFERQYQL